MNIDPTEQKQEKMVPDLKRTSKRKGSSWTFVFGVATPSTHNQKKKKRGIPRNPTGREGTCTQKYPPEEQKVGQR